MFNLNLNQSERLTGVWLETGNSSLLRVFSSAWFYWKLKLKLGYYFGALPSTRGLGQTVTSFFGAGAGLKRVCSCEL